MSTSRWGGVGRWEELGTENWGVGEGTEGDECDRPAQRGELAQDGGRGGLEQVERPAGASERSARCSEYWQMGGVR